MLTHPRRKTAAVGYSSIHAVGGDGVVYIRTCEQKEEVLWLAVGCRDRLKRSKIIKYSGYLAGMKFASLKCNESCFDNVILIFYVFNGL